jgi:Uma2 family endonuclease
MTVLPRDHPWTVTDLSALPDDGLRYELVDGTLLVSPTPTKTHQRAVVRLCLLLTAACPDELEVFPAPTDYQPTPTRSLQPDLLVVRRDDPGDAAVTTALALAVEVLSPSSRSVDRVLKRELYQQAGVAAYWVVDPEEPSVTVWELRDGTYGEARVVRGDDVLRVVVPFPVEITTTALRARGA